jgi:hypothetical protein
METKVEFFKVIGLENTNDARAELSRKFLGIKEGCSEYQIMTPVLVNIFETLCPRKTLLKEYTINAIPNALVDELQKIELQYGRFEIWYDDKQKDPICVAYANGIKIDNVRGIAVNEYGSFRTKEDAQKYIEENNLAGHTPYDYSSSATKYLIARWGDEIETMQVLSEKAKKRYSIQERRKLTEQKLDAEKKLAMLDLELEEKFFI